MEAITARAVRYGTTESPADESRLTVQRLLRYGDDPCSLAVQAECDRACSFSP